METLKKQIQNSVEIWFWLGVSWMGNPQRTLVFTFSRFVSHSGHKHSCNIWSSGKQSIHCSPIECLFYIFVMHDVSLQRSLMVLNQSFQFYASFKLAHILKLNTSTAYISYISRTLHDKWCCSVPQAVKSKYANLYIAGAADPEGDYQLDVDVSGLIFSHHPLFSREHVLGARLAQLYDQYLTRQHNNLTGHLTDKVNFVGWIVKLSRRLLHSSYIPEYI